MKNVAWAFQLSALQSYWLIKVRIKLHKSLQIQLRTWAHSLFVLEGLTVVQQSVFPSMHRGLVTERRPGPHVTRQNKRCQSHSPPTLSAHTHTHTHRLLSRLKFICCIQMPASNYTSTCGEWVSEQEREGREGNQRLLWGIWHCCYSKANTLPEKGQRKHASFCPSFLFYSLFLWHVVLFLVLEG